MTTTRATGVYGVYGGCLHLQRERGEAIFTHMDQYPGTRKSGATGNTPRIPRKPRSADHGQCVGRQPARHDEGDQAAATPDPLPWVESLLRAVGSTRVPDTAKGKWQCPAHATTGAHSVSLRFATGDDGRLLVFCHAGCSFRDILRALKLPGTVLMYPPPTAPEVHAKFYLRKMKFPAPKSVGTLSERGLRLEAQHEYGHPAYAWKLRYRHPTTGEKDIRWEALNPRGERGPGLMGRHEVDLPLYGESDLIHAIGAGEVIVLCESESSVDALTKAGIYATCWAGGASSPPERIRTVLGAANVVIVPDHDDAGLKCRDRLLHLLPSARVLLGEPGEDARDLLTRMGPRQLAEQVQTALDATTTSDTNPASGSRNPRAESAAGGRNTKEKTVDVQR